MGKKKKNYHKKNRVAKDQNVVNEKSSLNMYILIGMTVIAAFGIFYFSSI